MGQRNRKEEVITGLDTQPITEQIQGSVAGVSVKTDKLRASSFDPTGELINLQVSVTLLLCNTHL